EDSSSETCQDNGVTKTCTRCVNGVCNTEVTRHGKRSAEEDNNVSNTNCDNNGCTVCRNGNCQYHPHGKRSVEEENNHSTNCDGNGCTVCDNGNCT
ncbi:hypothetical protein PFISCL1PPCAC_4912, partial [Pristionchus fissidentatus]